MKLTTVLFGLSMLIISANAGLFDHDKAYYDSHLDNADEKVKDCKKAMAIARIYKDKEKFMEVMKDEECKAALDAVKAHKRQIWEEKRKAREKKEAEEKAKKKVLYSAEYKKQLDIFTETDYDRFMSLGTQDCKYYSGSFLGNNLSLKDAKCKAWKSLQKDKTDEAINHLLSQYPKEKILKYKNETCEKAAYGNPLCDLARKAYEQEKLVAIGRYDSDKELLKKDFNECHEKYMKLWTKTKYDDAMKLKKSYTCTMAIEAAQHYGVYGITQSMK
jgi:hypothetical protein